MPPLQRGSRKQTLPFLHAHPSLSLLFVSVVHPAASSVLVRPEQASARPPRASRRRDRRPPRLDPAILLTASVRVGAREPCTHSFRHTHSARVHPRPLAGVDTPLRRAQTRSPLHSSTRPSLNSRRPSLVRPSERPNRRPASSCRRYGCLHPIIETGRGTTAQRLLSSRRDGRAGDRREGAVTTTTTTTGRSRRWSGSGGWERPSAKDRLVRPRLDLVAYGLRRG